MTSPIKYAEFDFNDVAEWHVVLVEERRTACGVRLKEAALEGLCDEPQPPHSHRLCSRCRQKLRDAAAMQQIKGYVALTDLSTRLGKPGDAERPIRPMHDVVRERYDAEVAHALTTMPYEAWLENLAMFTLRHYEHMHKMMGAKRWDEKIPSAIEDDE